MAIKNIKEKLLQYGALAIMIVLGLVIVYALRGFMNAFLGAIIVYVLFRKMMVHLCDKRKWKRSWSALFIIVSTFLIVLVPIVIVTLMFIPKLNMFFDNSSFITHTLQQLDYNIKSATGVQLLSSDNIKAAQTEAGYLITGVLSSSLNALGQIAIMYFVLYFMLVNVGNIEKAIVKYLPLNKDNLYRFSHELEGQTFSNAIGAPVLGLIQGLFASLGYWIFGLQEPFFWGIMTGFFSFVPFVGSAMIWLPAAIYQYSAGEAWQAIGIVIYGIVVIGSVDNIFRFVFQKKFADVPPLITVFGVIIGFNLFGLVGLIFGPLMLSYLLIMFQIYKEQYLDEEGGG
ncbi:MAG: AI-2E family transporter [Bacteroidia bacterium]